MIFSLFPLAIVLTSVFGIVLQALGSQDAVVDAIVRNLPLSDAGDAEIRSLLEGATGTGSGLGLLALLPLAWAATGLMASVRYGLNRAWDVSAPRPYLQGKAFDLVFVLGTFLLVAISLGLSVGTSIVAEYASDLLDRIGIAAALATWLVGRLAPFVLALLAVTVAYSVLPATRPRVRDVWPSALGVALVLALLQSLFGLYVTYVNEFDAVFGSLAAVVASVYFVYLSANVFLFGAEVAAEIPRLREERRRGPVEDEGDSIGFTKQLANAVRGLVVRDDGTPREQDVDRRAAMPPTPQLRTERPGRRR